MTQDKPFKLRLRKTRLKDIQATHPKLQEILEPLGLSTENQIPSNQQQSAITTPDLLCRFLDFHPPLITPTENGEFDAITKTYLIYLARLNMQESTRISTLVADRTLSDAEISQIITLEILGGSIYENVIEKPPIWGIKEKLEENGTLASLGLSGHPKRNWAKWLGVDPRALKD